MNYQILFAGAMLQTGDPPMLLAAATIKHGCAIFCIDHASCKLVNRAPLYLLKTLSVADSNSSFD